MVVAIYFERRLRGVTWYTHMGSLSTTARCLGSEDSSRAARSLSTPIIPLMGRFCARRRDDIGLRDCRLASVQTASRDGMLLISSVAVVDGPNAANHVGPSGELPGFYFCVNNADDR